jgi:hypothetical protein
MEKLDPRWADLLSDPPAPASARPLILLLGDIESSSNVAFTEAYRRRRAGTAELWIAGHDSEPARRGAARIISSIPSAVKEALASGADVEVWVNPQEAGASELEALLAVRGKARILLLWNARNAGYLYARLDGDRPKAAGKPDLLLDVGAEGQVPGTKRIAWGLKADGADLAVPLPLSLWIHGRSHPTGIPGTTSGTIDGEALKAAAALI